MSQCMVYDNAFQPLACSQGVCWVLIHVYVICYSCHVTGHFIHMVLFLLPAWMTAKPAKSFPNDCVNIASNTPCADAYSHEPPGHFWQIFLPIKPFSKLMERTTKGWRGPSMGACLQSLFEWMFANIFSQLYTTKLYLRSSLRTLNEYSVKVKD